ncbi:MAG: hypothetical protein VW420_07680, partial [Schleiferiaceae bacterium]
MKKTLTLLAMAILGTAFAQTQVTFQVDMNQYSGTFTTPEVNGTFNGWCGNCAAMTDANGDNIWEVTIGLTAGDTVEYKFSHDNWTGQESLDATLDSACTLTTGTFTNRYITIGNADTTLPVFCWEECVSCGGSSYT